MTKQELFQDVIVKLGEIPEAEITTEDEAGARLEAVYPLAYKSMLESHIWRFALQPICLTGNPIEHPEFNYEFTVPKNWLRTAKVTTVQSQTPGITTVVPEFYLINYDRLQLLPYYESKSDRKILANESQIVLIYVKDVIPEQMSNLFLEALAWKLVHALANSFDTKARVSIMAKREKDEAMRKAVAVDSVQKKKPKRLISKWSEARRIPVPGLPKLGEY